MTAPPVYREIRLHSWKTRADKDGMFSTEELWRIAQRPKAGDPERLPARLSAEDALIYLAEVRPRAKVEPQLYEHPSGPLHLVVEGTVVHADHRNLFLLSTLTEPVENNSELAPYLESEDFRKHRSRLQGMLEEPGASILAFGIAFPDFDAERFARRLKAPGLPPRASWSRFRQQLYAHGLTDTLVFDSSVSDTWLSLKTAVAYLHWAGREVDCSDDSLADEFYEGQSIADDLLRR